MTPEANFTMIELLAPYIPNREALSVLPSNYHHPPFSLPVPNASDDGNHNLKDTLTQIEATMIASFASLE